MNPLLLTDYYKTEHHKMYPTGTTKIYSNFTPRKSRIKEIDKVVFFGLQHFILEYLIKRFNEEFFNKDWSEIEGEYKRHINVDIGHIYALWNLDYLPIEIRALKEGTKVPIGVPCFTIENTHYNFGWLTNYLETLISCMMWQPITSATIAHQYNKILSKHAVETTGSDEFVQWQGHDFSMRGMGAIESAITSGMGHLTSFTGTDCIPAIYQLEKSYNATGLIGASVPATEHSVMCMGTKDDEIGTFKCLLEKYPSGILSVVSDTWDLWKVLTEYLPTLKQQILSRDGKLVIRPDSGDPVDIICGLENKPCTIILYDNNERRGFDQWRIRDNNTGLSEKITKSEKKGVIELLWDIFGGTYIQGADGKTYKVLDSHIGAIYGDSITMDRAEQICERLKAKGFASTNVVLGIGSYTYQYNTRDTFGFAMKATYGEVNRVGQEIFKDPITDDRTKKSKKGLLAVYKNEGDELYVQDQVSHKEQESGELRTVFKDGKLFNETTLDEIRERIKQ